MSRRLPVAPAEGDWYEGGVRFGCTCSGKCCTARGEYEYVFVTRDEEGRLAELLGLTRRAFRRQHTRQVAGGQRTLRFLDGHCTFLHERQCSVYEARPSQCRTWPFWPENMDPEVWNTEVAAFCPGVGRGRLYTEDEIRRILAGEDEVRS